MMLDYSLPRRTLLALGTLLAFACAAPRSAVVEPGDPEQPPAPGPGRLERIAVIGASGSAGFGLPIGLAETLDELLPDGHAPVVDLADPLLFLNPDSFAERQVSKALAAEPTVVVAFDFLFWFGYGTVPSEAARLDLLEEGLAFLDRFECPIVISTFPNMSAAVGKMLRPSQMPTVESLRLLNVRVAEWMSANPRVVLLSLPELMAELRSGQPIRIAGQPWPPEPGMALMQDDDLHPTEAGLVSLGARVLECIAASDADTGLPELDLATALADLNAAVAAREAEREAKREARRAGRE